VEFAAGPAGEERWGFSDGNVTGLLECGRTVGVGDGEGDSIVACDRVSVRGVLGCCVGGSITEVPLPGYGDILGVV